MKRIGNLLLGLIVYSFASAQCEATTYNSNGTPPNVQYLHDHSAHSGDTITIPAGTFTWQTGVTLTKSIILRGAGVGHTIIKDAVQGNRLIKWDYSSVGSGRPRLTGIEFQHGGRTTGGEGPGGIIHITGSSENGSRFRMDNCKWADLNGVVVTSDVLGIVDHCRFENGPRNYSNIFAVYNDHFAGGQYSNGSWSAPSYFGTDKFLFFEDDYFYNPSDFVSGIADGYRGARIVVRHSTLYHKQVQMHGTDTGSYPARGARCAEIYNNTIMGVPSFNDAAFIRSGVWIIHNNSVTGFGTPYFGMRCYRLWADFTDQTFGGADGTTDFDVNATGGPFYSGVAGGWSGRTVTVQNANFTRDQWRGYQIKRTTNVGNRSGPRFSEILSNTSNTITYHQGYGTNLKFSASDRFVLYRVVHALDQPGRSGGNFVRGNPPVASGPNDQVTEPCYAWNNGRALLSAQDPVIRAGVHYFNNTMLPGYVPYIYPHPLTTN